MLRRALLGLITVLLVARPLLADADPGRLLPETSMGSLWLVLLWLLAAVAWASWRIWTGQTSWHRSFLEPGLLTLTALIFLSVLGGPRLRQAGWLFAWEWLAIFLAFVVVRQLPCSERETRSLLAVILATGVSLAAQAVFQALLPNVVTAVDPTLAAIYGLAATKPVNLPPFGDTAIFAVYLVLLAPALAIGWYLVSQSAGSPAWRRMLTGSGLGLVCLALGLTGHWAALVALLLANLLLLWAGRAHLSKPTLQWGALGSIGGLALMIGAAAGRGDLADWWQRWIENLNISKQVLAGHTAHGVGPMEFERHYSAYLTSPAADRAGAPANFLLEVLAGSGYWVLGMLLIVLVVYFVRLWPELRESWTAQEDTESPRPARTQPTGLAWEFYLGGMIGLTLALVFQLGEESNRRDLGLKVAPLVLRSLVWFAVFPFLDCIPWTPRWRTVALTAGTAAGLLCLSVTGGFFSPALALTFWVLAALALQAATRTPAAPLAAGRLANLVPVAVLALLWWTFLLVFVSPIARADSLIAQARRAYPEWRNVEEPRWRKALDRRNPLPAQHEAARVAGEFLRERILKPLDEAVQLNERGFGPRAELAYWNGRASEVFGLMRMPADEPLAAREVRNVQEVYINRALFHLRESLNEVDPQGYLPIGREVYRVGWRLRFLFAEQPGRSPENRQDQYSMAINGHLRPLVLGDPMQPQLHYWLADALRRFDPKDETEWKKEADRALELDRQAGAETIPLTPQQRQDIERWRRPQGIDWSWLP